MPIDPNVFDKIKTFGDYQKADQAFQLQKALQTQQLQTGGIDAASKANVYKTQLLSGAAAGGQPAYDQAKQNLQAQGIDTSEYAPDIQTATEQLRAARFAQSPLGPLFNAQQKIIGNNIAGTSAMGNTDNQFMQPVINIDGSVTMRPTTPVAQPSQAPAFSDTNQTLPSQPIVSSTPQGQPNNNIQSLDDVLNSLPKTTTGNSVPAILPANAPQAAPASSAVHVMPKFNPPTQGPNETLPAYKDRVQQAFEQYKADPNVISAQESAKVLASKNAENLVKKTDQASVADNTFGQLQQNIAALKQLSGQIPDQGAIFSPQTQAAASLRASQVPGIGKYIGSPDAANAVASYNEISEQQVINALKQLVSSGQIRGNQFIEKIISRGSLAPLEGTTDTGRQQILNQIQTELQNSVINAQNQKADVTGGQKQSFQPVPVTKSPSLNGVKFLGFK